MRTTHSRVAATLLAVLTYADSGDAMQLYSDGFDSLANWTVANQPDASVTVVDYSSLGIPEAPNTVAGSAATTGAKLVANISAGQPAAVNLIGAITGGNADLSLSRFSVSFDMYLSVASPLPSGSTEQGLWGLGRTTTDVVGRNNSLTSGDGVFGWLATENGYLAEDAVAFIGASEFQRLDGNNFSALFNSAFSPTISGDSANSPANQWVEVTLTADIDHVDVSFNSSRFFSIPVTSIAGDVMVGYEDAFSSVSSSPGQQFGLIDNLVIVELPPEFSGYYAPENWSTNTDGAGVVDTIGAPNRISLQGFDEGFVEYSIDVPSDGDFSFSWFFVNVDFENVENAGFKAWYFVNDELFLLSEDIIADGDVSVPVLEGDSIGWRVEGSRESAFGSSLAITDFSAPLPIPEPTSLALLTLSVTAGTWMARRCLPVISCTKSESAAAGPIPAAKRSNLGAEVYSEIWHLCAIAESLPVSGRCTRGASGNRGTAVDG